MPNNIETIKFILASSSVYVQGDGDYEGIRIDYCDEDHFRGTGEESGEDYTIEYTEVDLNRDSFYQLSLVNIADYLPKGE